MHLRFQLIHTVQQVAGDMLWLGVGEALEDVVKHWPLDTLPAYQIARGWCFAVFCGRR